MSFKNVAIIGAPLDLGAGRRGVDMGPSAIRVAGLNARVAALGYHVDDLGNVETAQPESSQPGPPSAKFLHQIADTCRQLSRRVESVARQGKLPLVLGGDHSVAAGTIAGLARLHAKRKKKIGVIWIDAHTDMNTPRTSPSGNVHGMPLACVVGFGPEELVNLAGFSPMVDPSHCVLVGIRDVDMAEREIVRKAGVNVYTMREVDELGMRTVMAKAIEHAGGGTAGFHVSFDMDGVDPSIAPGVGTPVRGGLSYREAHLAMEMIADSGGMLSMEVVEVNPVIDEGNKTAVLAVELILSGLGKKIL
jgi:arginase